MIKYILSLLFIVRVMIPLAKDERFVAVSYHSTMNGYYELLLQDGSIVDVPVMWTVITEHK